MWPLTTMWGLYNSSLCLCHVQKLPIRFSCVKHFDFEMDVAFFFLSPSSTICKFFTFQWPTSASLPSPPPHRKKKCRNARAYKFFFLTLYLFLCVLVRVCRFVWYKRPVTDGYIYRSGWKGEGLTFPPFFFFFLSSRTCAMFVQSL